jgi:hypothetical protein
MIGVYFLWEYRKMRGQVASLQYSLNEARGSVDRLTDALDCAYSHRMVFLHHSVGSGLLYQGGLRDSLQQLGISVRGATYGDEIGQQTDMADWLPKFESDMPRILTFKGHPDLYYKDGTANDIIMFKSCFPNSQIESEGTAPGNPNSRERTIANYKAVFDGLGQEMRKYPNKLFVYLTSPPLVPSVTTPEHAAWARQFNRWLTGEFLPSYLKETGLDNFVIFDLFDFLADENNVLKTNYRVSNPNDSHLNELANLEAVRQFMEFFRPVWTNWSQRHGVETTASR